MTCPRCEVIEAAVVECVLSTDVRTQAIEAAIASGNERPLFRELFRQIDGLYDVMVSTGSVVPQAEHLAVVGALRLEIECLRKKAPR